MSEDDGTTEATYPAWRWPVEQLGLVDPDKAVWMISVIVDAYKSGMDNTKIATSLRTHGGVMGKEEKQQRGLKPTARLGTAFYDALTPAGQADPVLASKAIVSRVSRTEVWVNDILNYEETRNRLLENGYSPARIQKTLKSVFCRGPRCCQWAYANEGTVLSEPLLLPVAVCDKPFCGCRTVTRIIKNEHRGCAITLTILGVVLSILIGWYIFSH